MILQPALGVITFIGEERESAKGYKYRQIGLAVDSEAFVATVFSGVSNYIGSFANKGSKIFIENWTITKKTIDNIDKYDIIISKAKLT
ncbi:MAG: hypothetical protein RR744_00460 [Cellulosilyticaceae bacterium]